MFDVKDPFNVTPKEYAEMARRRGKGMTDRGAQKFFKRQVKKSTGNFMYLGARVYGRRGWFEELFGQENTNKANEANFIR